MRIVLVLALVGCGPKFVKLDTARARKIDVGLVGGGNTFCSREPELRALVTYINNQAVQTRSSVDPEGTLRPNELHWTRHLGAIDANAHVHLPALRSVHDRPLSVTLSVPNRPEIADRIVLVPRFDCDNASYHDGRDGSIAGDG